MQDERSWGHNEVKIRQLWPKADFGDQNNELRKVFRKSLAFLNQVYLHDAIDQHKMTSQSWTPELSQILKAYGKIENQRNVRPSGPTRQIEKWWVDYERPSKHTGLPYKFSTDCPDRTTAETYAKKVGGRVRNYTRPIEQDDGLLNLILSTPREIVRSVVNALRAEKYIVSPLSSNISEWNQSAIGMVAHRIQEAK